MRGRSGSQGWTASYSADHLGSDQRQDDKQADKHAHKGGLAAAVEPVHTCTVLQRFLNLPSALSAMTLRGDVLDLVGKMDRDVDAVVVEGGHDREALERAGFSGRIYTCSENANGVVALAKTVAAENDAVSILTDFDQEGKDLYGTLREVIPERTVHPIWRRKLGALLTQKGRRDIESINNIIDG